MKDSSTGYLVEGVVFLAFVLVALPWVFLFLKEYVEYTFWVVGK